MRKTLIAVLLAAAIPAAALAMPGSDRHHGQQRHHAFKGLELSKEQREQFGKLKHEQLRTQREINQRYLDKLPEAERKAMQDEISAVRTKHQQDLRALLSAEQLKAFDEHQKNMEARRAERAEFLEWKKQKETGAN